MSLYFKLASFFTCPPTLSLNDTQLINDLIIDTSNTKELTIQMLSDFHPLLCILTLTLSADKADLNFLFREVREKSKVLIFFRYLQFKLN